MAVLCDLIATHSPLNPSHARQSVGCNQKSSFMANFLLPFLAGIGTGLLCVALAPRIHQILAKVLNPTPHNPFAPFSERGE
mgnify:CR=1 FL=1